MSFRHMPSGPRFVWSPESDHLIALLSLPVFMLLWGALQRETLLTLAGGVACLTALCWDHARMADENYRWRAPLMAAALTGLVVFFVVVWMHASRTILASRW